ncbi:MAG: MotA/TolQ/ExbB proton channel family protein [Deltaproteobacteria bacterium]|nr:MotA/TolQ/ExbB proton channel family protein [Deltaproteobacteria bacterium]
MTEIILRVTIAGGSEWVMVLLLALSVVSFSIIGERALFFRERRRQLDALDARLSPAIAKTDIAAIHQAVEGSDDAVLSAAIGDPHADKRGREAAKEVIASTLARQRLRLERRLTFLGTLGNNAPFIGLFGTVLGVMRAFTDLSKGSMEGHASVMAGISEALAATAVGLFVAIPAVVAFNYFQRQVDNVLSTTEALALGIVATTNPSSKES